MGVALSTVFLSIVVQYLHELAENPSLWTQFLTHGGSHTLVNHRYFLK